jgi:hypothetical protein
MAEESLTGQLLLPDTTWLSAKVSKAEAALESRRVAPAFTSPEDQAILRRMVLKAREPGLTRADYDQAAVALKILQDLRVADLEELAVPTLFNANPGLRMMARWSLMAAGTDTAAAALEKALQANADDWAKGPVEDDEVLELSICLAGIETPFARDAVARVRAQALTKAGPDPKTQERLRKFFDQKLPAYIEEARSNGDLRRGPGAPDANASAAPAPKAAPSAAGLPVATPAPSSAGEQGRAQTLATTAERKTAVWPWVVGILVFIVIAAAAWKRRA